MGWLAIIGNLVGCLGGVALGWLLRGATDRRARNDHRRLVTQLFAEGLRRMAARSRTAHGPSSARGSWAPAEHGVFPEVSVEDEAQTWVHPSTAEGETKQFSVSDLQKLAEASGAHPLRRSS